MENEELLKRIEAIEQFIRDISAVLSREKAQAYADQTAMLGILSATGHLPEIYKAVDSFLERSYSTLLGASQNQISVDAFEEHAALLRETMKQSITDKNSTGQQPTGGS